MAFHITKQEKILFAVATAFCVISISFLGWLYYINNSTTFPAEGGTYTEGAVGVVNFINPLFAEPNTVDADISSLVYSGLTKYDPKTKKTVPDMATYSLDKTKRKYTFTIKDNITWHDGEPFTVDDVLFTYKTVIQNPQFPDPTLRATFKDIVIEKTGNRSIAFSLKEPYYFFPAATTIGILPKHIWEGIPVKNLDKSEINLAPVGTGPYKFIKIKTSGKDQATTVDLQVFPHYYGEKQYMNGISFILYPTYDALLAHLSSLDAVNDLGIDQLQPLKNDPRYSIMPYTLPQYVALFLNTSSKKLEDKRTRLGLMLGTNEDVLLKDNSDLKRINTPLFEIKDSSWIYQSDIPKAQGALFDAGWKMKKMQALLPNAYVAATETPTSNYKITEPNNGKSFTTKETSFILRGTNPTNATGVFVNGYALRKFTPSKGSWSYIASTESGTLREGKNTFNVYYINKDNKKTFLDSITITYDSQYNTTTKPMNTNINKEIPPVVNDNKKTSPINVNSNIIQNINANMALPVQNSNINAGNLKGNLNSNENTNINVNSTITQQPALILPNEYKDMVRYNSDGEPLMLDLITTSSPEEFGDIAKTLQTEWLKIGVYINIEILAPEEIVSRIQQKTYDIILYGQSLGYNLDTFPYWHSSQADNNGLNLSNFKSFQADTLLEEIRNPYINKSLDINNEEQVQKSRLENLKKLIVIFENNIPAIFLYQPTYFYAVDTNHIRGITNMKNLSYFSDRFSLSGNWYRQEKMVLKDDFSIGKFINWITTTIK